MENSHSAHHDEQASGSKGSRYLKMLGLGTALTAGALILSPYLLPALGVGTAEMASDSLLALHGKELGNGLARFISKGLDAVPFIGETLAKGGYASALTAAGVGLGGMILGQFLQRKKDGSEGVNWGKVITYGALATSALIALPSVLTSIGVGVTFLSAAFGSAELAGTAAQFMANTLGTMAPIEPITGGIASSLAVTVPHLISCGTALLPAAISFGKWKSQGTASEYLDTLHDSKSAMQSPVSSAVTREGAIAASIAVQKPTTLNEPCHAILTLKDRQTGKPITPSDLAEVHTKKIHLLVTDSSLRDYKHIHPEPTDVPGKYSFSFTPSTSNSYSVWADVTTSNRQNHKLKMPLPAAVNRNIKPAIKSTEHAEAGGLSIEWKNTAPLKNGTGSIVEVTVKDAQGRPVNDLEPVMGAYAHLVGFSADGNSMIHAHPLGKEPASSTEKGGPQLKFHLTPDFDGKAQFHLQLKRGGKDIYAPFGQEISPKVQTVEKRSFVAAQQHSHGTGAHAF